MNLRSVFSDVYKSAKTAGGYVAGSVRTAVNSKAAYDHFKSALPYAAACAGGFGLLSFAKNRVRDGKPKGLEKNSGNLAALTFAALTFKKFFVYQKPKAYHKVRDFFSNLKNRNFKASKKMVASTVENVNASVKNTFKVNKSNLILYAASIVGVKILADAATKVGDTLLNSVCQQERLGD